MNKMILLIAGSGLSRAEIRSNLRELYNMSEARIFDAIDAVRTMLDEPSESRGIDYRPSLYDSKSHDEDRLVADQITQMLRVGTGLTTDRASRMLLRGVGRSLTPSERARLPKLNKDSFSNWLMRLIAVVPPSVLLQEAAKIRNMASHTSLPDWPLEDK